MEKTYNTTWYQKGEEPNPSMPCPKCNNGVVDTSQYGGYWCKNCKWKWKLSKYPPKGVEVQRESTENKWKEVIPITNDDLDDIRKRLSVLEAEIGIIPVVEEKFTNTTRSFDSEND